MKNLKRLFLSLSVMTILLIIISCSKNISEEIDISEVYLQINDTIKTTAFINFKFQDLLTELSLEPAEVFINEFNVNIDKDGYINSFNISYSVKDSIQAKTMFYRRKNDLFKILEDPLETQLIVNANVNIFDLADLNIEDLTQHYAGYDSWELKFCKATEGAEFFIYGNPLKKEDDPFRVSVSKAFLEH